MEMKLELFETESLLPYESNCKLNGYCCICYEFKLWICEYFDSESHFSTPLINEFWLPFIWSFKLIALW